jgi:uncharacterized protein (TIGR01777 family)
MNVFVTGATGFIGRHLVEALLAQSFQVTSVGRTRRPPWADHPRLQHIQADTTQPGQWQSRLAASQAVINLAGAGIFRRWTNRAKDEIRASRLQTTRHVVAAMAGGEARFLFSASGIGYYGDGGDEILTERSRAGDDFLARLAVDWETAALDAQAHGVRVAIGRFGVVLDRRGGALARMAPAFRHLAGGPLGSGRQWFPWIHLADLIAAILFLMQTPSAAGAYNFCAPQAVTQADFAVQLGRALHRPAVLPAPAWLMRTLLGEFSQVLLASQRVEPQRLLAAGYRFRFPQLADCLEDLFRT